MFYYFSSLPAITKLKFNGALQLGVGSSSGHVLLYDIRSSKPLLVKDHMNEIPIKNIEFHKQMNYVYSMDSLVLKIWEANTVSKKSKSKYVHSNEQKHSIKIPLQTSVL